NELDDGAGEPDNRRGDHRRGVVELPGSGCAATRAGMGFDAGRWTVHADGRRLVADDLPGSGNPAGGAGDAVVWRLAAHTARSTAAQSIKTGIRNHGCIRIHTDCAGWCAGHWLLIPPL